MFSVFLEPGETIELKAQAASGIRSSASILLRIVMIRRGLTSMAVNLLVTMSTHPLEPAALSRLCAHRMAIPMANGD